MKKIQQDDFIGNSYICGCTYIYVVICVMQKELSVSPTNRCSRFVQCYCHLYFVPPRNTQATSHTPCCAFAWWRMSKLKWAYLQTSIILCLWCILGYVPPPFLSVFPCLLCSYPVTTAYRHVAVYCYTFSCLMNDVSQMSIASFTDKNR